MRPALLYSDTQSVVSFSVIPKCLISNDLEWLFRVVSAPVWLTLTVHCEYAALSASSPRPIAVSSSTGSAAAAALFPYIPKNIYVKTNKDRHTLPAAQMFR